MTCILNAPLGLVLFYPHNDCSLGTPDLIEVHYGLCVGILIMGLGNEEECSNNGAYMFTSHVFHKCECPNQVNITLVLLLMYL